MKYKKRKFFNLVEIALALGILAIGLTAVLSLLPVGFSRNRQAIGENYCAEAADSMFSYISRIASIDSATWDQLFVNSPLIPVSKLALDDNATDTTGDWVRIEGDIYTLPDYPNGLNGNYGILVKSGDTVDFTGEVLIWQSNLPDLHVSGTDVTATVDTGVGVNMEISWPVEKPYIRRDKNYYYIELYNSNS